MPSAAPPHDPAQDAALPPAALRPTRIKTRSLATARTVMALILREMSTRYGRSPGGYVWAVLEPLAAVIVMAVGFSLLVRTPSLGNSFILFYATGYMPFSVYQGVSLVVARSITFSRPLLMYPSVTWMDAVIARFVLNSLTAVMVTYLLMTGILMFSETGTVLQIGPILMAMGLAALFGLGVGAMNCLLLGLFPAWELIWSIVTRPLFLVSGVILLYEDMPRGLQDILWYNPLMHIAGLMRRGFYPMYSAQYVSVIYVAGVSLVLLALGFILLQRYHKEILNA